MSEYTIEDFERADFAKHPDGRLAIRLKDSDLQPWRYEAGVEMEIPGGLIYSTDEAMRRHGFEPMISHAPVTEKKVEEIAEGLEINVWSAVGVIEMAFGLDSIKITPETEEEKLAKVLKKAYHPNFDLYAQNLVSLGVTTNEGETE